MTVHRVYAAWRCCLNETLESAQVISSHSNVSVSNISSHSNVYAKISIALSLQKCAFQAMLTIHPLQWNRYRNDLKLNQWWSMWRRQLLILQLQVMWTSPTWSSIQEPCCSIQEPCFLTKIHSDEFSEDGSIQLPACKHSHCHKDCGQEALAISFCQYCVIFKISLLHFFENITQYLIYEVLVYFRMIFMCIVQTWFP